MTCTKKRCVVKRTVRVVCPDDCNSKFIGKKKKKKKKMRKRIVRKVIRKVLRRACPAPQIRVDTPAPVVNVSTPPPTIHVEAAAPIVNVDTKTPIVHVDTPAPVIRVESATPDIIVNPVSPVYNFTEMRDELAENIGNVIEVICPAGAGSGGEVPNRVGIVESVGRTMFALRSQRAGGYVDTPVVYYTISRIVGFVVRGNTEEQG